MKREWKRYDLKTYIAVEELDVGVVSEEKTNHLQGGYYELSVIFVLHLLQFRRRDIVILITMRPARHYLNPGNQLKAIKVLLE